MTFLEMRNYLFSFNTPSPPYVFRQVRVILTLAQDILRYTSLRIK